MGTGACVALIAIGAVLTFATELHLAGVDVNAIGVILMVAGALGLVVTLQVHRPRRRSATTPRGGYGPGESHHRYPPPAAHGPYAQQPPPGPQYY